MIIRIKRKPQVKITIRRTPKKSEWFSIHSHSKYSLNDALPTVEKMVAKAKALGYKGLGLMDHGNIAGSVRLYQECMKAGIKPFPGSELYIVHSREDTKAKRQHLGVVAFTEEGYRNLVHLSTLSHQNFHHKPVLDFADLAALADEGKLKGLACATGCFFGVAVQALVNDGYDAAKQVIAALSSWFDACYVELQMHNIDQEPMSEHEIMDALVKIADELGLKTISGQDSHYVELQEQGDHDVLKKLVTWSEDESEAMFPGDGFHMPDDAWMKDHMGEYYERSLEGLNDLLDRHTLRIPEMDVYKPLIPSKHADPKMSLWDRCNKEMKARGLEDKREYNARLASEMDVINYNGMASYILLIAEVTDYCRANGIFFQARGSASGSMVCWLMGITPVDPIKWDLLMERFLSKSRLKMPDIDLDIQSSRRQELVEYLSLNYSVTQIGTWSELGLGGERGKGSLWVKVMSKLRKQGRNPDVSELSEIEWEELERLAAYSPYTSVGKHAGGLLMLGTREELNNLIPRMWIASSSTMVSQYDMKDVEKLGLVKLDALGLSTMDVLQQTIVGLGRDPREMMDFIPLNDKETYKALSKGDTDGVFQLEGGAMKHGIREVKPRNIEDVVATVALYRPATMNNGGTDQFVSRRHNWEPIPERHQMLMDATKKTQGILLYQEQMINVLRDMGMSAEELSVVLKAIKASNGNIGDANTVMQNSLAGVRDLAQEAGMNEQDVEFLERSLLGYAEYGFNRSHAVVYGITAYRCAWLATNHPVEFYAALLTVASGTDKEPKYVAAARRHGVKIIRAELNASGAGFRAIDGAIAKGFRSIDGLGEAAARELEEQQPYRSLEDLAEKVDPKKVTGTRDLQKLIKKAAGDKEELDRMFNEHQFPGVIAALKRARVFRLMVKEEN